MIAHSGPALLRHRRSGSCPNKGAYALAAMYVSTGSHQRWYCGVHRACRWKATVLCLWRGEVAKPSPRQASTTSACRRSRRQIPVRSVCKRGTNSQQPACFWLRWLAYFFLRLGSDSSSACGRNQSSHGREASSKEHAPPIARYALAVVPPLLLVPWTAAAAQKTLSARKGVCTRTQPTGTHPLFSIHRGELVHIRVKWVLMLAQHIVWHAVFVQFHPPHGSRVHEFVSAKRGHTHVAVHDCSTPGAHDCACTAQPAYDAHACNIHEPLDTSTPAAWLTSTQDPLRSATKPSAMCTQQKVHKVFFLPPGVKTVNISRELCHTAQAFKPEQAHK